MHTNTHTHTHTRTHTSMQSLCVYTRERERKDSTHFNDSHHHCKKQKEESEQKIYLDRLILLILNRVQRCLYDMLECLCIFGILSKHYLISLIVDSFKQQNNNNHKLTHFGWLIISIICSWSTNYYQQKLNTYSRFQGNLEAFALELHESYEELLTRYYMRSDSFNMFMSSNT